MDMLESTISGTWYPGSANEIRALANEWENRAKSDIGGSSRPNILIVPHAGWEYSGEIAWQVFRRVRGAAYSRVVILAPSHRAWIENRLVAPEAAAVATPLGPIAIDREFIDRLALSAPVVRNDGIHRAEHSAQIEYPFLQLVLAEGFKLVPLVMGAFGADQMAMCARALSGLMDEHTLLVVSSDFTHYGADFDWTPFGAGGGDDVREKTAAFDSSAISLITRIDRDAFAAYVAGRRATICGHVPIELALRSLPARASLECVKYGTSGDVERDFSRFVCYAAIAGHATWQGENNAVLDPDTRAFLLRLARKAIEAAVRGDPLPRPPKSDIPLPAMQKMGVFVTLNDRITGALRGCIGEIMPMRPLVEGVVARAVDSALHDPRFPPVSESELAGLRVEVSALTPPKPVSSWRDIVLGRDGMTLEKGDAFAVFLPQVAPEQAWDLATTLSYLSQKAGLPASAWRDGATFETFQAEVFHE